MTRALIIQCNIYELVVYTANIIYQKKFNLEQNLFSCNGYTASRYPIFDLSKIEYVSSGRLPEAIDIREFQTAPAIKVVAIVYERWSQVAYETFRL